MLFRSIANASWFAGLPANVQSAIDECAVMATAYQHEFAAAEDDVILKKIDPRENEIIELTGGERAAFVRAMEPVLAKYRGQLDARLFTMLAGE